MKFREMFEKNLNEESIRTIKSGESLHLLQRGTYVSPGGRKIGIMDIKMNIDSNLKPYDISFYIKYNNKLKWIFLSELITLLSH